MLKDPERGTLLYLPPQKKGQEEVLLRGKIREDILRSRAREGENLEIRWRPLIQEGQSEERRLGQGMETGCAPALGPDAHGPAWTRGEAQRGWRTEVGAQASLPYGQDNLPKYSGSETTTGPFLPPPPQSGVITAAFSATALISRQCIPSATNEKLLQQTPRPEKWCGSLCSGTQQDSCPRDGKARSLGEGKTQRSYFAGKAFILFHIPRHCGCCLRCPLKFAREHMTLVTSRQLDVCF